MHNKFLLCIFLCFLLHQASCLRCFSCMGNSINDTTQSCTQTCQSNSACYFQLSYASIDEQVARLKQVQQLASVLSQNQLKQDSLPMEVIFYGCVESAISSGCIGNAQKHGFVCYCSTDGCNNPASSIMGRMIRQAYDKRRNKAKRSTSGSRKLASRRRPARQVTVVGEADTLLLSPPPGNLQLITKHKKSRNSAIQKRSYLMRRPSNETALNRETNESESEQGDGRDVSFLLPLFQPSNKKKRSFLPTGKSRLVERDEEKQADNKSHVRASRSTEVPSLPPAVSKRIEQKLNQEKRAEALISDLEDSDEDSSEYDADLAQGYNADNGDFEDEEHDSMEGYKSVQQQVDEEEDLKLLNEPPHLDVLNGILN